jgi:integrase
MDYALLHYSPSAYSIPDLEGVDFELLSRALPQGFPFFADLDTGEPHKETLHFLAGAAGLKSWRESGVLGSKVETYANDLKPFMDFTAHHCTPFAGLDQGHFEDYLDLLLARRKEADGEALAPHTRRQRLNTALRAVRFSDSKGWSNVRADETLLRAELTAYGSSLIGPKGPRWERRRHRPFLLEHEWLELLPFLGPLPSSRAEGDLRPTRCRVSSELVVSTGLRGMETEHLETRMFMGADVPDGDGWIVVQLEITKGLEPRPILVPHATAREIQEYVRTDRAWAIAKGRSRADFIPSDRLFVHHVSARRSSGDPITAPSLSDDFRDAVVRSGHVITVEMPSAEGPFTIVIPRWHLHGLRHTFAMWLYAKRVVELGDKEPWLHVSARLGHVHVDTTTTYYVKLANALEVQVADLVGGFIGAMINAA